MTRRSYRPLWLFALATSWLGCAEAVVPCLRTADCGEGRVCVNGTCRRGGDARVGETDCSECIEGWICQEGRCAPGCALTGCPPGLSCDPRSDACLAEPVCLEVEDCSTATDDDCDGDVACADSDCDGESCSDGFWCNGEDTCVEGTCTPTGLAPCEGACDEDADRCGECSVDMDCGATETGDWSSCSFDDTCSERGSRSRPVVLHSCVDGVCMRSESRERDSAGCGRDTDGVGCGDGRCFGGGCVARCATGNNGSVTCGELCVWCGGSCAGAEARSDRSLRSCSHRDEPMDCFCNGI